jgi:hypothetical protein
MGSKERKRARTRFLLSPLKRRERGEKSSRETLLTFLTVAIVSPHKEYFHLFVQMQTKGLCSSSPGRLRANARKKQAEKQKQMKKRDQYADICSFS